jgi:hypothetical protein
VLPDDLLAAALTPRCDVEVTTADSDGRPSDDVGSEEGLEAPTQVEPGRCEQGLGIPLMEGLVSNVFDRSPCRRAERVTIVSAPSSDVEAGQLSTPESTGLAENS